MKSIQYTIRNIPPKVDSQLRMQAKKRDKSFNATVVEALKQATGVTDEPKVYHDLDWFKGSLLDDPEFDQAMEWLDSLPKEIK